MAASTREMAGKSRCNAGWFARVFRFDAMSSERTLYRVTVVTNPDREGSLVNRSVERDIRILLVEDNDVNSRLATRMLTRLGYQVDAVLNGREAIRALQRHPYSIVLMDLNMPEMDGLAATRWILSNPGEVLVVPTIIALTANTLPEDRKRCEESGMVDFIAKPIGFESLSSVLEKWSRRMA